MGVSGEEMCPSIVFVPSKCNGFTDWCVNETDSNGIEYLGCEDYVDQCAGEYSVWDIQKDGNNYKDWIDRMMKDDRIPEIGGPKLDGPNKNHFGSLEVMFGWVLFVSIM